VKESLEFFARIKGLPEHQIVKFGEEQAKKFRLHKFYKENTLGTKLSGGNKRKLVTAVAMMANPAAVFLDESSAGVDPFSRRKLW
jgi:ABC-type multidrug transport system ATPase subunit